MVTIDLEIGISHGGKIYGPGKVELDDSKPEQDSIAQALENRVRQIGETRKAKLTAQEEEARRMLIMRAASGDQEALKQLRVVQASGDNMAASPNPMTGAAAASQSVMPDSMPSVSLSPAPVSPPTPQEEGQAVNETLNGGNGSEEETPPA